MKRDLFGVGLLWLALSVAGVFAAATIDFYPEAMSDKGHEIERAFRFLLILSMPVCALVVAVLAWTLARSASFRRPDEDGMDLQGKGAFPITWLIATTALAAFTMAFGVREIPKVMGHEHHADVVVDVQGIQWTWLVAYPDHNVTGARELVLPVDKTVKFNVTSLDVLHSFWVPSFLMKIDAVPGLTTEISLKPTKTGSFQTDPGMRLQCTGLCGLSHSRMSIPVRVVTQQEFDEWVASKAKPDQTPVAPSGPVEELTIVAKNVRWDQDMLHVTAGANVKLTVDNQDNGIQHNWALYTSKDAANAGDAPLAATELTAGPVEETLTFVAPEKGEYFYRCDVHPSTMAGTLMAQ